MQDPRRHLVPGDIGIGQRPIDRGQALPCVAEDAKGVELVASSSFGLPQRPCEIDGKRPLRRRISDVEPRLVCTACGQRGAEVKPNFDGDEPPLLAMRYRNTNDQWLGAALRRSDQAAGRQNNAADTKSEPIPERTAASLNSSGCSAS